MESTGVASAPGTLWIRLFGTPAVLHGDVEQVLPTSRKVLMLLAYLVLADRPAGRSDLCDLLWDGPVDPRGELRWALSKLRRLLEGTGRPVLEARSDQVSLALSPGDADALTIRAAIGGGHAAMSAIPTERLQALEALFGGELLAGVVAERSPAFESWLAGQRRQFRNLHLSLVEHLAEVLPIGSGQRLAVLERRAALMPSSTEAHLALLEALAGTGDIHAAETHLAAAGHVLAAHRVNAAPLHAAWQKLRQEATSSTPLQATARPAVSSAAVDPPAAVSAVPAPSGFVDSFRGRPRLAVMPPARASAPQASGVADAVTHDVINRLARLRALSVIAWGSVSALARRGLSPGEAAQALQADYCASTFVIPIEGWQQLQVELVDVREDSLLWSDTFDLGPEDGIAVMEQVAGAVVASLSHVIEQAERDRALIKAPGSLNAWETYHRGLWHMYQFTQAENGQAQALFRAAAERDPTFARAHAGLSFTHWQNAFQRWGNPEEESRAAHAAAARSLLADERDPTAHWAMGRALWLRGGQTEGLAEIHRAIDISPSFAMGHYALAFIQSQSGDPEQAILAAERSRQLSPFDPLLFGIYAARAMANARLENFEEGSHWALLAAAQPNAHHIILAIAAHCLPLAGRLEEARSIAGRLRLSDPGYRTSDFLTTFRFSPEARTMFLSAGRTLGLA